MWKNTQKERQARPPANGTLQYKKVKRKKKGPGILHFMFLVIVALQWPPKNIREGQYLQKTKNKDNRP